LSYWKKECFTIETFVVEKVLYKQKIFVKLLPILINGFNQTKTEESKSPYLIAMGNLMKYTPKGALQPQLPQILPLAIKSLMSENQYLKRSTVKTFENLVSGDPSIIVPHLSTLVPIFLQVAQQDEKIETRISALVCIQHISKLPFPQIFPFKILIINGLKTNLDDKKRSVRKQAQTTRNAWFLLK